MKRLLLRLTILSVAAAGLGASLVAADANDDAEPNSTCATANDWSWDRTATGWSGDVAGSTSTTDSEDWGMIRVFKGEHLHVAFDSPTGLRLSLRTSCTGSPFTGLVDDDSYQTAVAQTQIVYTKVFLTTGGTYGAYTIAVEIHANDGGVHGQEAGDPADAVVGEGTFSASLHGRAPVTGDVDWWRIAPAPLGAVLPGNILTVTLTVECAATSDVEIALRTEAGNQIGLGWPDPNCGSAVVRCTATAPASPRAVVYISETGAAGGYTLGVDVSPIPAPPPAVLPASCG